MARVLRVVGLVWCWMIGVLIAASLAMILIRDGLGKFWDVTSPFNLANVIATMIALAPGLLCLWWAEKLQTRAARP